MEKIIICTTAICRKEIHKISFRSYIDKIKKITKYKKKWIINIDRPEICEDSKEEVIKKIREIIGEEIETEIITGEKASFVEAYYRIIRIVKDEMREGDIMLWLEDDWVFNENFEIEEIIKTMEETTEILYQLNYNKIGTLPPFMMDYKLFKKYYEIAEKIKKNINPEKISRQIYRIINKSEEIKYINKVSDKEYEIIKKDKMNKMIYEETYLKIKREKTYIMVDNKKEEEREGIKIIDKLDNIEGIKILRRGIDEFYINKKYSYVKDIGREWLRKNKISKEYKEKKKDMIMTIYYTKFKDPQRDKYVEKDSYEKMRKLYESVKRNNLEMIIFYDELTEEFRKKYETEKIKFIWYVEILKDKKYELDSMNDMRFMIYYEYLEKNKDKYGKIMMIDLFDEEINGNIFNSIKYDKLYVSYDRDRDFNHYYIKDRIIKTYGSMDKFMDISQNKIITSCICGYKTIIKDFLCYMKNEFEKEIIDTKYNNNYIVFNYVAYKYFIDKIEFSKDGNLITTKCGTIYKHFSW